MKGDGVLSCVQLQVVVIGVLRMSGCASSINISYRALAQPLSYQHYAASDRSIDSENEGLHSKSEVKICAFAQS